MVEERFKWPPKSVLTFYSFRGGDRRTLFKVSDRLFDLSDGLMLTWPWNSRTVYMGVSTASTRWDMWDDENLEKVEWLIREDLTSDGYRVRVTRLYATDMLPCSSEFLWQLQIRLK